MNAQGSTGDEGGAAQRPDAATVELEVARLPEVLHSRLALGETGVFVEAHVVARRGSFVERVARDVQSVVAVVSGIEIPLERIAVVADEAGLDEALADVPGPAPVPVSTSRVQTGPAPHRARSRALAAAPLDAAAARLLERALRPDDAGTVAASSVRSPAWGELLVRPPPAGGHPSRGTARGTAPETPRPARAVVGHLLASDLTFRDGQRSVHPPAAGATASPTRGDIFLTPADPGGLLPRWLRRHKHPA